MGTKLKIIILDDELNGAELLQSLVEQYLDLPFVVFNFQSASSPLLTDDLIYQSDIVFMDAEMPFFSTEQLLNKVHPINTQVVLCTAYSKEKFSNRLSKPVYYLPKPVDIENFTSILDIITQRLKAIRDSLII